MNFFRNRGTALVLIALVVCGLALASAGIVVAQEVSKGMGRGGHALWRSAASTFHGDRHGLYQDVIDREVLTQVAADTIGVTPEALEAAHAEGRTGLQALLDSRNVARDTVRTAIQSAVAPMVESAVTNGTLTQEQADHILSHADRDGHGELHALLRDVIDRDALKQVAADTIGVTLEELEAAKAEGKTGLQTLLDSQNVDMETVKTAIQDAVEEMVAGAVTAGTLTQEQADQILERHADGDGYRSHGRHGRGRGHGFHHGRGLAPTETPAEDAGNRV